MGNFGPFTTKKRGSSSYHEPHLSHQRDDYTMRQIDSFFNKSYIKLPLTGVILIVGGVLFAEFEKTLIDFMRVAGFHDLDGTGLLPQKIAVYTGAIFLIKGFHNLSKN